MCIFQSAIPSTLLPNSAVSFVCRINISLQFPTLSRIRLHKSNVSSHFFTFLQQFSSHFHMSFRPFYPSYSLLFSYYSLLVSQWALLSQEEEMWLLYLIRKILLVHRMDVPRRRKHEKWREILFIIKCNWPVLTISDASIPVRSPISSQCWRRVVTGRNRMLQLKDQRILDPLFYFHEKYIKSVRYVSTKMGRS